MAHEFFYDFDSSKFTKYRLDAGVDLPKVKGVKSSLYYKLMTDLDDGEHTSSLVLKVEF